MVAFQHQNSPLLSACGVVALVLKSGERVVTSRPQASSIDVVSLYDADAWAWQLEILQVSLDVTSLKSVITGWLPGT